MWQDFLEKKSRFFTLNVTFSGKTNFQVSKTIQEI